MSVVICYQDLDVCDLRWWSASTVVPGGGQYQLDWSVQLSGQPIAFTLTQQDGLPASASIALSGVEYIKQMQIGSDMVLTTANIPELARNETLTVFGQGTAGGTLTFSILMKHPTKRAEK